MVAPGEPVADRGPACAGRVSGAGGGAPGWRVAIRGLGARRTAPGRPPRRPVQHGAPCSWLALSGLVWAGHEPCWVPPWLRQTAPQPGRGKARARPSLEDSIRPPSPRRGAWWACGPLSKPSLALAPGAALVAASGRYLPRSQSSASCASLPPPSAPSFAPLSAPTARRPAPGGNRSCWQRGRNSPPCQPFQRMPSLAGGRPARCPACAIHGQGPGPRIQENVAPGQFVGVASPLALACRAQGLRPSAPGLAGQHGAPCCRPGFRLCRRAGHRACGGSPVAAAPPSGAAASLAPVPPPGFRHRG